MANCPNCGSDHIQIKRETNVNWGRAAAGWALFGAVGGAVGAVTGEDRNVNACLDCGTSWKAEDLYKIRQIIKEFTGANLDLARENDRVYMAAFMQEVGPYIRVIGDVEKSNTEHLKVTQGKLHEGEAQGCAWGCMIPLAALFTGLFTVIGFWGSLLLLIVPPLIGVYLGSLNDKSRKQAVERDIERAKMQTEQRKLDAEETLRQKLAEFESKYLL